MKRLKLFIPFAALTIAGFARAESMGVSQIETATSDEELQRNYAWDVEKAKHLGPPEGMGFMWPGNPSVPEAVSKASDSVFTIVAPDGDLLTIRNPSKALRQLQKSELSQAEKKIFSAQLSRCLEFPQRVCKIIDGTKSSSAYVTGDGKDLRTALHAVQTLARAHERYGRFGNLPIYILKDGKLIAEPKDSKPHFTKIDPLALKNYGDRITAKSNMADQVVIRLEKKLATPLVIAKEQEQEGEPIFIIGSPKKTNDREQFGATDSDGKQTWISRGKALGSDQIKYRAAKLSMTLSEMEAKENLKFSIATSADSAPGMSGGPVVNQYGEVLGTLVSGSPYDSAHAQYISYGARLK